MSSRQFRWVLDRPEEVMINGIIHRASRWAGNATKLTDCEIHHVDRMACIALRSQ